ncbi:MAG: helix-turn-helix transcriptional regulator [Pirellulales bacterium]|nr:helix-turn-helix transcriptional regulator [Pirellulales bacterium]
MSIVELSATGTSPPTAGVGPPRRRVMHRVREVRMQQGVSLRAAARRIGCEVSRLKDQERDDADMSLSDLYAWQKALGVPVQDLLVECDEPLSAPVLEMSRMIRLAKTIATIQERTESQSVSRLADMLMGQLLEMMPELSDVGPWPTTRPRTLDDLGRVCDRRLSEDALRSLDS